MPIVIILDQRDSRSNADLVTSCSTQFNQDLGSALRLPFERTAGDEMQALIGEPEALGRIVRQALAGGHWTIGIGVGAVEEPLPDSVREGRGPAYWAARQALVSAGGQRQDRPVAVRCAEGHSPESDEAAAMALERCLGVLAFILNRRTDKQREAADIAYEADYSVKVVIESLKLSPQGAHQRLNAAGSREEADLIELATELARPVVDS